MIGQVKWPPYQAIDKVQPANSVNPKPFGHGNTELNSTKVDKCVENINGQPQVGYDVFRTLWKHSEPTGNKLVAQQCVVTDCVMLMMVGYDIQPPYMVTSMENFPNSVNPKPFGHGNTEPSMNSNEFKACVENVQEASILDEDSFRACVKMQESPRNEVVNIIKDIATTLRRNRHDKLPGREGNRNFSVQQYHWVNGRPSIKSANSVNAKPFGHANTELSSEKSDKCVQTIHTLLNRNDIVGTYGKPYESPRNEVVACLEHVVTNWVNHRERAHLPDSRYRSRFVDYNPALHPHRQICTGSYLN